MVMAVVRLNHGYLALENCGVHANSADQGGGGVSSSGTLVVGDSSISLNDVPVGGFADPSGGGIEVTDGKAEIRYVSINDNVVQGWGGGLYVGEKASAILEEVGVAGM